MKHITLPWLMYPSSGICPSYSQEASFIATSCFIKHATPATHYTRSVRGRGACWLLVIDDVWRWYCYDSICLLRMSTKAKLSVKLELCGCSSKRKCLTRYAQIVHFSLQFSKKRSQMGLNIRPLLFQKPPILRSDRWLKKIR